MNLIERILHNKRPGMSEPEGEMQEPKKIGYLLGYSERMQLGRTPVWFYSSSFIEGNIPETTIGLIETTHGSIRLLIGEPDRYPATEVIGSHRKFLIHSGNHVDEFTFLRGRERTPKEERISQLTKSYQDALLEQQKLKNIIEGLTQQLVRLRSGQIDEARTVLSQFVNKQKRAHETVESLTQHLNEGKAKFDQIVQAAARQLVVRSLNGDITLSISDPDLAVVVSDEFNQGEKSITIMGNPPLNPTHTASVFTCRGKISITYLDNK